MKKRVLNGRLSLNKAKISNFNSSEVLGGYHPETYKCPTEEDDCNTPVDNDHNDWTTVISMMAGMQCDM